MISLTPKQEANLRAALAVTDDLAQQERLAFAIWTESKALIYANGGLNTSHSPGFDKHPEWPGILRQSLFFEHDAIGNNGRSTGMLQQISADVGGAWGDMAGTMDPATSARRFLSHLRVTDDPVFVGKLLTPTGSRDEWIELSDPIAADVLRVQQPLADEARSSNYDSTQVLTAKTLVAQLGAATKQEDWFMASNFDEAKQELVGVIKDNQPAVIHFWDQLGGAHFVAFPAAGTYLQVPNPMGDDGVLAAFLGQVTSAGYRVVEAGQADPFMFGHRLDWSDRPASTTAY